MSRFFKPYEGGKPFLFISYPHKNSAEVLDTGFAWSDHNPVAMRFTLN